MVNGTTEYGYRIYDYVSSDYCDSMTEAEYNLSPREFLKLILRGDQGEVVTDIMSNASSVLVDDEVFEADDLEAIELEIEMEKVEIESPSPRPHKSRDPEGREYTMETKYYNGKPGQYFCRCHVCARQFYGDKRDVCCPTCTGPNGPSLPAG